VTDIECDQPSGHVDNSADCDDFDATSYPGGNEVCDGADNDCDNIVDPPTSTDASTWYADTDNDGYGDSTVSTTACDQPSGYVGPSTDCNDSDSSIHPGAIERCDGFDNNCDNVVDENLLGEGPLCAGASCLEIRNNRTPAPADDEYHINPGGSGQFEAYCDMTTDGGGWTMVLRVSRFDGAIDFRSMGYGWSSTTYSTVSAVDLANPNAYQDHVSRAYDRLQGDDMLLRHRLGGANNSLLYAVRTSDAFLANRSAHSYISQSMIVGGRACSTSITYLGSSPQHQGYTYLVLAGNETAQNGQDEPARIAIRDACDGDAETLHMGYKNQPDGHGDHEVYSQSNHWGSLSSMFVFVR
jgi:hypothetical protein